LPQDVALLVALIRPDAKRAGQAPGSFVLRDSVVKQTVNPSTAPLAVELRETIAQADNPLFINGLYRNR
jgi:hypothetical protein